ncbi:AMP-binding protein [Streptomyces sp. NPDC059900]|uniref:AMP-binding protein n=1 Tax=Streptomyces sp. NPDC059900 TaxID=3155816 RepID=UPI003418D591
MPTMLDGCTPWPPEFADRYWSAGHWRGNTLENLLRGWALQYGPRTALVHGATRLTYANLNRRVDRTAAGFRLRGVRPRQRVMVQLPNVPEFVVTVFALMRVGAIPVICPLSRRASEMAHVARVSQAAGYVGPSTYEGFDHTAMAADIAAQGAFLRRVFTLEAPGTASPYGGMTTDPSGCHYFPLGSVDAPPGPALDQSADQVAFFLLSEDTEVAEGTAEGAASPPELIARTHNDYAYQARAAADAVSLTEDDVYLAALPAGSNLAFGCPGILGTLCAGGTVVLPEDRSPAAGLAAVGRERVTVTSLTPATARLWLDALPAAGAGADMSSLRLVQLGGAPTDRETAEPVATDGLGRRVQRVFAMAEGLLVLARPDGPEETGPATRGRPLSPDDEIRVAGADGKDVPDGEAGELLARGPYTPRGYYRAPVLNARCFTADGYFRTGHLARRLPDGDLLVTGRVDAAEASA